MSYSSGRQRSKSGSPSPHRPFSKSLYARSLRCEPLEARRLLAQLTVTTDQDIVDFTDGVTSLREAIFAANLVPGADEIIFDFGHDGPATILLTQGELQITDALTITGSGAELLTIDASGIQDVNVSSVFVVGSAVTIEGITLTGAKNSAIRSYNDLTLVEVVVSGNSSRTGGGISSRYQSLTVLDSLITQNTAGYEGGGIHFVGFGGNLTIARTVIEANEAPTGGGIRTFNDGESSARLEQVTLRNNTATLRGGGIHSGYGNVEIVESLISGNQAGAGGGISRIDRDVDRMTIDSSTIVNNTAGTGGGVSCRGTLLVNKSSFSGNSSTYDGGGISTGSVIMSDSTFTSNVAGGSGGAIFADAGGSPSEITNSTLSANRARQSGGAISSRGSVHLLQSTVVGNIADEDSDGQGTGGAIAASFRSPIQLEVTNSIVASNRVGSGAADEFWLGSNVALSVSHSLIGTNVGTNLAEAPVGSPDANGNLIGGPVHGVIDPLLGPLADNGGPTLTHALLPGSPAIDAGDPAVTGIGFFDQRGAPFARVFGAAMDIGAFEAQSLVVDTLADENDGDYGPGEFSLREAIDWANQIAGANTIEFSPALAGGTIFMTMGEYAITEAVEIVGLGAELLEIDAQQQSRVFSITAITGDFTFSGMTLTRGSTSAAGSVFGGGAISSLSKGLLALDGMQFTGNRTLGAEARGGAVAAMGGVQVSDSRFLENSTAGNSAAGGALYAAGDITVEGSIFTANQTAGPNAGGGAVFTPMALAATGAGFVNNRTRGNASPGGAIHALSVEIEETTISGNSTVGQSSSGGAIRIGGPRTQFMVSSIIDSFIIDNFTIGMNAGGGGIFASATVTIERSTISGNSTFGGNSRGGAVSAYLGTLTASMVANNRTYGTSSPGGGVAGYASQNPWQIQGTTFVGNETFGGGSSGGGAAIEGGLMVVDSTFDGNSAFGPQGGGGAISATRTGRNLLVDSSTFTNNSAGRGGAIASEHNSTIVDSVLTGNRASLTIGGLVGGGAIDQGNLPLTILRSTVSNNQAIGQGQSGGGGIRSTGPTTIVQSELSNNRVIGQGMRGGGVFAQGPVAISATTISENQVIGMGGAGGGVFLMSANVAHSIVNTTISGNQITGEQARGGGLYSSGRIELRHSTVTNNQLNSSIGQAGGVWVTQSQSVISHSIIAGNLTPATRSDLLGQLQVRYSLIGTNVDTLLAEAPVGSPDANGNLVGGPVHGVIDPRLAPLADNGGPTRTHALLPDSPALNAGDPNLLAGVDGTPLADQRGVPFGRVAGGRIDIGAFEAQPTGGLYNADFDSDGDVDGRDFLTWQRGYGQTTGAALSDGDAMQDGDVDGLDLAVWREMYGTEAATGSARISEITEELATPRLQGSRVIVLGAPARDMHQAGRRATEPAALDVPPTEVLIDRAFEHWLPPRRLAADFGDMVVQRTIKRRAEV